MADSSTSISLWWVLLFLVLALGAGAGIVLAVGGSLVASGAFLPLVGLH